MPQPDLQPSNTATLSEPEEYFILLPQGQMHAMTDAILPGQRIYWSRSQANLIIAPLTDKQHTTLASEGARIIQGRQYQPLPESLMDQVFTAFEYTDKAKSLKDVLQHISADKAWSSSTGKGVHIAIVDTGVCGTMPEFPAHKKAPASLTWPLSGGTDPWSDPVGHGSMTACIATATDQHGGKYSGVAPNAQLISCRSSFQDTELYQIYEHLIGLVENKSISKLVVNNSYGFYACAPSGVRRDDPFPTIVLQAIAKGIFVVFAAGNNHVAVCNHNPQNCSPNSIWATNSLDEVVTVGTVDEKNRMDQPCKNTGGYCHRDSSRGPGELSNQKPDCVAPTYGEVMWGCGYRSMEWWGTSGAAPQVAGLGALILSKAPWLTPSQVSTVIMDSCVPIGLGRTCAGAGLIDCSAALLHDLVKAQPEAGVTA